MEIKTFKQGNFVVHRCIYDSLDDFLNALIKEPINYQIFSELFSITNSYSFCKTQSFKEAWELCKYTYDEGYEDFSNKVKRISYKLSETYREVPVYKVVGSSANVQRYLMGIPNNMRSKETILDNPVVKVHFQAVYDYKTTFESIYNRGILVLSLINYLLNVKKVSVEFDLFELRRIDNEIIYTTICLKNKNEDLHLKKCYFPLVHPSFTRRLIFRSTEIIPQLQNKDWSSGYGYPLKYMESLCFLDDVKEDDVYISTPSELGIYGNNIDEDADRFINHINEKYNLGKRL